MALTPQEEIELQMLLELEYRDKVKVDYREYIEYCHDGLYKHAKHTEYLCSVIQSAIDKKKQMVAGEIPMENQYIMLSVPPRHGKSMTITETFPSFYLGNFPNDRVILGAYGENFATKFGKKNKDKVEMYGSTVFGIRLKHGSASSTDWDIDRLDGKKVRGGVISRGMLSGVTGEGADLMIIDDPIKTREEANSQATRDKIWGEWVDSFSTRLHPGAIVIIIMTRWHEDDLIGRLLDKEYGDPLPWQVINLPLECDSEDDLLGREIGEPLWAERYGKSFIEDRKKYPSSFNSLYQGRPTSQEGNMVKRDWWKRYKKEQSPTFIRIILSVDATFKESDTSDFVSLQVWGKRGTDSYLIDRVKKRMDFPTTIREILTLLKKYPDTQGKYIEDKANGSAIISVLRRKIPGIIAVNPKGSKIARVSAVSDYIEAGNVYLPDEPWVEEYIEEWASFPKGKNDDDVDAGSQALNQLFYYNAAIPEPEKALEHFAFRSNLDEDEEGDYITW